MIKIGLCGSHGVGKTHVFDEIIRRLSDNNSIKSISEIPRHLTTYWRDNELLNTDNNTFALQNIIMIYQLIEENLVSKRNLHSLTICDRTIIDHLAYTIYFHGKCYANHEVKLLESILIKYLCSYDVVFYIPIEFDIKGDNIRSDDKIFQKKIDNHIQRLIKDANAVTLSGSVKKRSDKAIQIISDRYELQLK